MEEGRWSQVAGCLIDVLFFGVFTFFRGLQIRGDGGWLIDPARVEGDVGDG